MTDGRDWNRYYDATRDRPPRPTLLRALDAFAVEGVATGLAVDLGSGIGRDALPLLRRGWRVLAVDAEAGALGHLRERAEAEGLGAGLETLAVAFEAMALPTGACDLVNASFSLFACTPADFPAVWGKIVAALRPGGRFAGQLIGERDSWCRRPATTTLTRAELDRCLAELEVERLEEEEDDSTTPQGEAKHWHIWHVNARKAAPPPTL